MAIFCKCNMFSKCGIHLLGCELGLYEGGRYGCSSGDGSIVLKCLVFPQLCSIILHQFFPSICALTCSCFEIHITATQWQTWLPKIHNHTVSTSRIQRPMIHILEVSETLSFQIPFFMASNRLSDFMHALKFAM